MLFDHTKYKSLRNNDRGFTLVEIMVATVISLMIISSVYAAFRSSLSAYEHNQARLIILQKCRMSLDRMSRDFNNLFYAQDDEELTLFVEDYTENEQNTDQDMVSFVTLVNPNLTDYLNALESGEVVTQTTSSSSSDSSEEEETENILPSDLARVVYFIGQSPRNAEVQCLFRVETTELDTQEVEDMLSEIQSNSLSDEVQDLLEKSILVDNIGGFNVRYFDGEDWADTWDMEEQESLPKAVELTLTVNDAENKEKPITQAVVIYLPFSASDTEDSQEQQTTGTNQSSTPMQ